MLKTEQMTRMGKTMCVVFVASLMRDVVQPVKFPETTVHSVSVDIAFIVHFVWNMTRFFDRVYRVSFAFSWTRIASGLKPLHETVWGKCSHVFHMHCLIKWLHTPASKQQCPMDRRPWGKLAHPSPNTPSHPFLTPSHGRTLSSILLSSSWKA